MVTHSLSDSISFAFWKQLQTHVWFKTTSFSLIFPLIPGTLSSFLLSVLAGSLWAVLRITFSLTFFFFFLISPFYFSPVTLLSLPSYPVSFPLQSSLMEQSWSLGPFSSLSIFYASYQGLVFDREPCCTPLAFSLSYPHTDINVQHAHRKG